METPTPATQEETFTNFPPLERSPLRFRGVFGVAWQLYKRGFKGLVPLGLLLYALPFLLAYLPMLFSMSGTFAELSGPGMHGFPGSAFRLLGFGLLGNIALLAITFLLLPALNATMYMEMDQCADGRRGSFRQLLKAAFSVGFKPFYTTFLAYYVALMGVFFAVMLVCYGLLFAAILPITLTVSRLHTFPVGLFVLLLVITLGIMIAGLSFLSLVYPVAVRERLRAFKAVGRGMSLAAKRFWRIFAVMLVYMLVTLLLLALLLAPVLVPLFGSAFSGNLPDTSRFFASMPFVMAGYILVLTLLLPYTAALYTALYIDASSRTYPVREQPQPPAGGPVYGQPVE